MFLSDNRFIKIVNIFLLFILLMVIFILPVKVKAQAAVNTYLNFLDLAKLAQAIELLNEGKEILISCEDCSLADIRRVTINQSEFAIGGTEGQSNNIRINGAIEDLGYIYIFNYALDSWFVLTSYIDLPKVLDAPLFFHAAQFSAPKSTTKSVPSSGSVTVGEYDQFLSLPTAEIVAQTKQRLENSGKVMMFCEPCSNPKRVYAKASDFTFDEREGVYYFMYDGSEADLAYTYIYRDGGWVNLAFELHLDPKNVSVNLLEDKLSGPTGCYCYLGDEKIETEKEILLDIESKDECEQLTPNASSGNEYGGKQISACVWNQSSEVNEKIIARPSETSDLIKGVTGIDKLNIFGNRTLTDIVGKILRAVIGLMGSIAFVMFVYGGLTYMTAMGNAEKKKKAQKILVWTALGLFVILGSYTILAFVMQILPL